MGGAVLLVFYAVSGEMQNQQDPEEVGGHEEIQIVLHCCLSRHAGAANVLPFVCPWN